MSTEFQSERSAQRSSTGLRVYLLGPPRVEWAGDPLDVPRRQVRALLYLLAVRPEPVPRERLCFLFWPDVPESKARRHLSSLLSHLRRALPASDLLLASEDHVRLGWRRVWSDTLAFERLWDAAHQETGLPGPLQQAVDLYRGPFLDNFSLPGSPEFETWASLERQNWERQYLEVLSALIEIHEAREEFEAAIACGRRYLTTDELAEDVHHRLIQLYAAAGDRKAAAQQYEHCAIVLERELGISPLPETLAAYRAIWNDRPRLSSPEASLPTWTTLPSLETPLVGRGDALRQLERAYIGARSKHGGVVLISGEPGIGKSRLMQDFVTPLAGDATLLTGSGHEVEQGLPYGALIEALRARPAAIDWAALNVEPVYVAEAARLMPELSQLLPDLPAPHPVGPGQQQRLFQALTRCLQGIASFDPPLILCLDNLQWLDMATISYLGYLARHLEGAPILVLGAYRVGEAASVAAIRADLLRLGVLEEIRLAGLTPAAVRHLIHRLSAQSKDAARMSQRLHRETGGNPFFLLEIMRHMFETGILAQDKVGWSARWEETSADHCDLPLPDTVHEAIRDRLRRLGSRARQVLEAGAVIGHRFDYDMVWKTSGRSEDEVVEALEILLNRQLVAEQNGEYWFIHDLVRGAVYDDLSYGRRRFLHRRAGQVLERLRPESVVALTRHFERAEQMDKAVGYLIEAGEQAMRVADPQDAVAHLTRALVLFETLPDRAQRARQELRLQLALGVSLQITRGYGASDAGRAHARARELCRQLGDTQQLFAVLGLLFMFHTTCGEHQAARDVGEELFAVAEQSQDASMIMVSHWQQGTQRLVVGELAEARTHLEEAVARYDRQRHHPLVVRFGLEPGVMSLAVLSWALWALGYPEQAQECSQQAIALAAALAYPPGIAVAQSYASGLGVFLRDWRSVQKSARALLRISTEHGLLYWRTAGLVCLGWALAQQEKPEEGIAHIRRGLADSRDMGAEMFTVLQSVLLAEAWAKAGQVEQGLMAVDQALYVAQQTGERFYEPEADRLKGDFLLARNEIARAEDCFHHALGAARQQGAQALELRAAMSLSRLWRERDEREKARRVLTQVYDCFTEGFDTPDLKNARMLIETL